MATTKEEFQGIIAAEISNFPSAAILYQAKDQRLLASLNAQASMLSNYSVEQGVESAEPFTKSRDMTVYADASVKGILPFGQPTRVELLVSNANDTAYTVNTGRRVLDTQGRIYIVDAGGTIGANSTGIVTATQQTESFFDHTVGQTKPFYTIAVPNPEDGRCIVGVRVKKGSVEYLYQPEFTNVDIGALVFNLYSDELRTLNIEFGANELVGYQANAGEVYSITVLETEGSITIDSGALFAFEYSTSLYEGKITVTLSEVVDQGRNPYDTATLREITKYPAIYDNSAVFLGNFEFLVRKTLSPFRFLSIWNEQREEEVRGADIDNINRLFVTALKDGVDNSTLETQITRAIKAADDSYRITYVAVDEIEIPVSVAAQVSAVYDFVAVEQQIVDLILTDYGRDSNFAKYGNNRILYKKVYDLLRDNIQALQGDSSDFQIVITDPVVDILPEQYRYVSADSLTIAITQAP